ncbi:hypothetical protein [Corynebacterium aquilae]|uniref:Uncharacterized protein n=1 Tax=Corynebacterium aquilae DSM 44791 TaxID=1431546 RepID=A0A1L7CFW4_9CORY|nr:hypothetical protein [Corynebacterium aquilae]APT84716.1 hypothetical protein CAQU_06135 [Corynebacterium aquilae DSM 44791]
MWPIVAILIAVVLAISGGAWMGVRDEAQQEHARALECFEGNVTLPVYADGRENVVEKLLRAFSASNPIVDDHCVTATMVDTLPEAAVMITSDPARHVEHRLSASGRSSSSAEDKWPVAFWESIVLATAKPHSFASWTAAEARATIKSDEPPMLRAMAATALADKKVDHAVDITKRPEDANAPLAMGESVVPPHVTAEIFDDVSVPFRAVALTATASVDESQSRAAKALLDFLRENIPQDPNLVTEDILPSADVVYNLAFESTESPEQLREMDSTPRTSAREHATTPTVDGQYPSISPLENQSAEPSPAPAAPHAGEKATSTQSEAHLSRRASVRPAALRSHVAQPSKKILDICQRRDAQQEEEKPVVCLAVQEREKFGPF